MEIIALVVVMGVPLVIALTVLDTAGRRVRTWHTDEQIEAASGVFRDRPAGMATPVRPSAAEPATVRPVARRSPAPAPSVPGVTPAGIAQPASRHAG